MKLLSEAAEYGLRAVTLLAQRPGETLKSREIAEATHSAPGYLVKVLQALSRAEVLSARRGSTGGFCLERQPTTLTVLEVVSAIDPIERIRSCPLGLKEHAECLCPLHQKMDEALAALERDFGQTTIHDLLIDASATSRRCSALSVDRGTQS